MILFPWNNSANLRLYTASAFPAESLSRVTISMSEGMHDIARIDCVGITPAQASALDQMPVMIEWGSQADPLNPLRFVGYVSATDGAYHHSTRPLVGGGALHALTLSCLGATTALQSGGLNVWQKRTIPSVFSEIADTFRLSSDFDTHDYVWPRLAQAGRSYWEFINTMADQIGYSVIGNGTHLRLVDPAAALARSTVIPLVTTDRTHGPWSGALHLVNFSPTVGSYTSTGHTGAKVVMGLHANTGKTFTYSTANARIETGLGDKTITASSTLTPVVNAVDVDMAQALADGIERKMMWASTAVATTSGGANVGVGSVVWVEGFSSDYDGPWYVRGVEYDMQMGSYHGKLDLGRNTLGAALRTSVPAAAMKRAPVSTLINGTWVAATRG